MFSLSGLGAGPASACRTPSTLPASAAPCNDAAAIVSRALTLGVLLLVPWRLLVVGLEAGPCVSIEVKESAVQVVWVLKSRWSLEVDWGQLFHSGFHWDDSGVLCAAGGGELALLVSFSSSRLRLQRTISSSAMHLSIRAACWAPRATVTSV